MPPRDCRDSLPSRRDRDCMRVRESENTHFLRWKASESRRLWKKRGWEVWDGGEERGRDKRERQRVVGERGVGGMDECTAQRVSVSA